MKLIRNFTLVFHPASEEPIEAGDYIIFNPCDGFHVAELLMDEDGERGELILMGGGYIPPGFYWAWAKLPDTSTPYACFTGA